MIAISMSLFDTAHPLWCAQGRMQLENSLWKRSERVGIQAERGTTVVTAAIRYVSHGD
jgi:hypothetical protein